MSAHRFGFPFAAALSVLALAASLGEAGAQQTAPAPQAAPVTPQAQGAAPPQVKPKSKPVTPGAEAAAGAGASASTGAGGDQALKKRVEQLEAQLVDMQVVIGTLESLARSGVRPPSAPVSSGAGLSGSDQARIDSLETQIRALSAQVEQLSQGRRSDVRPPAGSTGSVAGEVAPMGDQGAKIGQWSPPGAAAGSAALPPVPDSGAGAPQDGARFGAGPVTAGSLDPIGPQDGAGASTGAGAGVGAAPGAAGGEGAQLAAADPMPQNPKQLYEQAYGFLLQQNYASAQAGFSAFLKNYPKDGLAPNALYWLGETHYVQRNYSDAAEAFDLVTSAYGSSIKAPDAQLKRGMSLAQLGKKQEACTAFRDLATKFPSAPVHIKQKADGERQRNACP